jgi:hypothetical protein
MKIFIPRVPKTVSPDELRAFSLNVLENRFHIPFTTHPSILSCDVLRIKDAQLGLTEHHGLISIRPDSAGQWFISNIKNNRLNSKLLFARQYHTRRSDRGDSIPGNDRRRKHLEIGKMNIRSVYVEGLE